MDVRSYVFHSRLFQSVNRRNALTIAGNAAVKLIQERANVAELFASAINYGMRT